MAETHTTLSNFLSVVPVPDNGYHFVGWAKTPIGEENVLPEDIVGEYLTIDNLFFEASDNPTGTVFTARFVKDGQPEGTGRSSRAVRR